MRRIVVRRNVDDVFATHSAARGLESGRGGKTASSPTMPPVVSVFTPSLRHSLCSERAALLPPAPPPPVLRPCRASASRSATATGASANLPHRRDRRPAAARRSAPPAVPTASAVPPAGVPPPPRRHGPQSLSQRRRPPPPSRQSRCPPWPSHLSTSHPSSHRWLLPPVAAVRSAGTTRIRPSRAVELPQPMTPNDSPKTSVGSPSSHFLCMRYLPWKLRRHGTSSAYIAREVVGLVNICHKPRQPKRSNRPARSFRRLGVFETRRERALRTGEIR